MNELIFADCLDVLKDLHKKHPDGFIDLIYIDPPFNSKRDYNVLFESIDMKDTKAQKEAFSDTWSNVSYLDTLSQIQDLDLDLFNFLSALDKIRISKSAISYLTTMAIRIHYMHKVLKDTGSFYLHCDPTMSHYLKLVCDLIFGEKNFRNEIIWHYRRWTGDSKSFLQMHDVILFYAKNVNKIKFNALYTPYTEKSLARKQFYHTRIKGDDIYETDIDEKGVKENDVWHIQYLNSQAKERLGYPTQKPEALLERIITASSNEGDLVADFFCGCGTTISVAEKFKRKWIGVDISHLAIKLIIDRLTKPYKAQRAKVIRENIHITGFPRDIAGAKELAQNTDKGRFGFQDWIIEVMIGGVVNPKKVADGGYDGYLTFLKSDKERGTILIEVKSGKINVTNLRGFIQVVKHQKAELGVFVCFKEFVTSGMLREAKQQGYFENEHYPQKFDKIQIITVEDLLDGKDIHLPSDFFVRDTFKKASKKHGDKLDQIGMELE